MRGRAVGCIGVAFGVGVDFRIVKDSRKPDVFLPNVVPSRGASNLLIYNDNIPLPSSIKVLFRAIQIQHKGPKINSIRIRVSDPKSAKESKEREIQKHRDAHDALYGVCSFD